MQDEEGVDSVEVDDLHEYLPGAEGAGSRTRSSSPTPASAIRSRRRSPTSRPPPRRRARRSRARRSRRSSSTAARVRGVRVGGELLECDDVVLAAGPWSGKLAAGIGLELPLEITREQDVVFATAPEQAVPCAVSSQADRVYLRPAPEYGDGHVLVGRGFPKEYETVDPDGFDDEIDAAFEEDVRDRVAARLPRLAGMRAVAGRVGLYDVTPDWHPLLGPVDGLRRAAPRDRRQRPLLQARPGDRRARRRRDHRQARRLRVASRASRSRASPRAARSRRATAGTAREPSTCGSFVALLSRCLAPDTAERNGALGAHPGTDGAAKDMSASAARVTHLPPLCDRAYRRNRHMSATEARQFVHSAPRGCGSSVAALVARLPWHRTWPETAVRRTGGRERHEPRPRDPERHGLRRHGRRRSRADVAIEDGRIAGGRRVGADGLPRARRGRPRRRARLHRHPQPLRLHAARRPARGERDPPGRHARGRRQLRLRLLPDPSTRDLARKAIYGYDDAVPIEWRTAGGYFERLEQARPAVNVLSLVPNGQLRLATRRPRRPRRPTPPSSRGWASCCASRSARARGATRPGSSTRRSRARPRRRSPRSAARSTGSSTRRTRARRDEGAVRVGRGGDPHRASAPRRGCRSRTSCRATGSRESRRSIELVERARDRGLDVEFDMHTRRFGITHLYAALPPWALGARRPSSPRCCRTPASATACARTAASSAPGTTGRGSSSSTTRSGPSTRAATSRRSRPSAGQEPLDAVYDLLVAGGRRAAQADGDHPRLRRGASSARRSRTRAASRAPTRRRSRPTARSASRSSTARTPGPRGSGASWCTRSGCSPRPPPCTS